MMKLYNTLTRSVEEFVPIDKNEVKMYTCGPTVYHYAHIGNLRTYIMEDVLEKTLNMLGYNVKRCMNITDVGHLSSDSDSGDDKMLKSAKREHKSVLDIAKFYTDEFKKDTEKLNIKWPSIVSPATENIDSYIKMIEKLLDEGYAYKAGGNVYFDTSKLSDYYILTNHKVDDMVVGVREGVEFDSNKKNQADFVLWFTKSKFDSQELKWDSPFGVGYPGWHIECSAMSRKYLGKTIDIHAGGADLIFPHHENEIAQSECANGCKFVNYWLHNGFVTINKEKMSKSLGNFLTIDELLKKYDSNTIRFFILTNHYRMPVEFSDEALSSAQAGVKRMLNAKRTKLNEDLDITKTEEYKAFTEAMDDDLNTSKALAVLFELTNKANKDEDGAYTILYKLATVLGFTFEKAKLSEDELKAVVERISAKLDEKFGTMEEILAYRKKAREEKNWAVADKIRVAFDEEGIILKDSKEGTTWELK